MSPKTTSPNAPNGWSNNWISQGQIYGTYGPGIAPYIQDTLIGSKKNPNDKGFKNGAYGGGGLDVSNPNHNASIDALMTYFGSGYAADNRTRILTRADLTGIKSPWLVSNDINLNFIPVFVLYTNDASTDNSSFNIAIDIDSTGGTSNGLPMPVNVLINSAITAGAFLGARIKAAIKADDIDPSKGDLNQEQIARLSTNRSSNFVLGDLLFTPDGFGSFVQNYNPIDQSFAPASNPSWTGVRDVQKLKDRDNNDNGWLIQFNDSSAPDIVLPETVRSLPVKVNFTGNTASALVTANQQDIPLPALKVNDAYSFQKLLSQALDYLNTNQQSLQAAGVVFPEVNLGQLKAELDATGIAKGFSPTPGAPKLPDLIFSGKFDDYLAVQAYLIKLFAGGLNVSTVLNAWMGGTLQQQIGDAWSAGTSSLRDDSPMLSNAHDAAEVAARLNSLTQWIRDKSVTLGWFKAAPYLDYLAIDKYGDDELSINSNSIQNITFNRNAWINYFYFTKQLAENLTTGPSAGYNPTTGQTTGNTRTLLFQLPASSMAVADASGKADDTYYKYASTSTTASPYTLPFLSNASDALFGNGHLSSQEAFSSNFPSLASTAISIPGNASSTTLDSYLFSSKPNALENSGQRDLTTGLLQSGPKPVINDVLSHIFGIIWSSGTESAPINYRDSMWGGAGLGADPTNTDQGYKSNAWNTSVLSDVLEKIRLFKLGNNQIANFTNQQELTPRSVRLYKAWIQVDNAQTSYLPFATPRSPAKVAVKLRMIDQNPGRARVGLYRIDRETNPGDTITGSIHGINPESKYYRHKVMQEIRNKWITDPSPWSSMKKGRGYKDLTLHLEAGARYGIALLSGTDLLTSFAAANPLGNSHSALLPTTQLMEGLSGIPPFAKTQDMAKTLGFEHSMLNNDWDYNDISITPLSGAQLMT